MKTMVLGNSLLTVTINENADIAEMYFPYVGLYQLVDKMYMGVWEKSNGINWLKDSHNWTVSQAYIDDSQIGVTHAINKHDISLTIRDFVYPYLPIFVRDIIIESPNQRDIKLFSYHDIHFTGMAIPDSAVYDKKIKSIVHYELSNYILIGSIPHFTQLACGRADFKGLRGTFVDAEDGDLSGCTASHGPVDSAIGVNVSLDPQKSPFSRVSLFFCAGQGYHAANNARKVVHDKTIDKLYDETFVFWNRWLKNARDSANAENVTDERLKKLFNVSVLITALMCDHHTGSIIASPDADIMRYGGDTYLYCWPRDAAFVVKGFDSISQFSLSRKFFDFCIKTLGLGGYWLHRYCPDGSFGPTWHDYPFIQVDQTGSVLFALDSHCRALSDLEYLRNHKLWEMIKGAAEFLMRWRDEETRLPKPISYDLWEERTGIFTYSSSAVYGGLLGASRIAHNLGKLDFSKRWYKGAEEIKEAIQRFLWNPKIQRFRRSIKPEDDTVDSSLFGIWFFDVLPPSDGRVRSTMKAIEDHLLKEHGVCRYQGDTYQGHMNPWIICTLFLAEYYLWINETEKALKLFHLVADNALETYLLPEQVDSKGTPLSVVPLTWSHSQYLIAFKQLAKQLAK